MQDVFLVEDSHLVLERLESLIATVPGARVSGSASSAEPAIRAILERRPDLVLCDLKLAGGSGFEVLRAVRAAAPEIDVVMLSNFASEPYRRLAAQLGAADFFDKSSEIERVRDLVASRATVHA